MNKTLLLSISFLCLFCATASAQSLPLNKRFEEAVRLEAEGEKRQASDIWSSLAADFPENGNLQYRAGISHLQSFDQKTGALPFLKLAEEIGTDAKYDPISPQEKKSPITLYFYLGKAYHLNYNLDKAKLYYEKFTEVAPSKHFLFADAVLGVQQVGHAKVITAAPVPFNITNLGDTINSPYPDYSPVISIDENSIFYTSRRLRTDSSNLSILDRNTGGYYDDIYVSYKDRKGNWQIPELLNINSDIHTATMNVAPNGQTLYIYRDEEGGSIFESSLVGETWTTPVKLPTPINSSAWETHLAATVDGETVYFVSDRKGGFGGRDIWRSKKLPNDTWSEAYNMGASLNTQYEEDAVFISPDENTLYFSSQGHTSIGGFDVFSSKKDAEGNWGEPENIGYPINTADDDVFFVTSADGKRAYFSSFRKAGYGEKDIYLLDLPEPQEVKLALLKGVIIPAPGDELPKDISVAVTNKETMETSFYTPRARDGNFVAILPPCFDYNVEYFIDGNTAGTDSFSVDCESSYREIEKTLLLNPVLVGDDGKTVFVSTTTEDNNPATFKKFFGYNANEVALEEEIFRSFIKNLKIKAAKNDTVEITILGSASQVPTKTFGKNKVLADLRASNAKERILNFAKELEIDPNILVFKTVEGKVQGPTYKGDYLKNKDTYRNFQYVEVVAK
ncbi:MAG: tetratricopeptide (TPR) repeat protein [Cryomorphaceae bacterium]|jgi:tetratricopeptide (TPR) repeat protein